MDNPSGRKLFFPDDRFGKKPGDKEKEWHVKQIDKEKYLFENRLFCLEIVNHMTKHNANDEKCF